MDSSAPTHLDVAAFAKAGRSLSGEDALAAFARVAEQAHGQIDGRHVSWHAGGESRAGTTGAQSPWLHLEARCTVPMICQRCLNEVDVPLRVDRWFRFVVDEDSAAAEDDEAEEDLLVLSPRFDLAELIEDELVLELPVVARHERCELPLSRKAANTAPASEDPPALERRKPFAALEALKSGKGSKPA